MITDHGFRPATLGSGCSYPIARGAITGDFEPCGALQENHARVDRAYAQQQRRLQVIYDRLVLQQRRQEFATNLRAGKLDIKPPRRPLHPQHPATPTALPPLVPSPEWTCPSCGGRGQTREACYDCGTPRPPVLTDEELARIESEWASHTRCYECGAEEDVALLLQEVKRLRTLTADMWKAVADLLEELSQMRHRLTS